MSWDQLNEIIQRHGGAISAPVIIDAEIDNPSPNAAERARNPKVPNPNPTYRYNLKDGKYFTAKALQPGGGAGTGQGDEQTTFQIVDPGSAVQPLTPADRLPSPVEQLQRLDINGKVIPANDTTTPIVKVRDPSTGAVTDWPDAKTAAEGTYKEFGDRLLSITPDSNSPNGFKVVELDRKPPEGTAPKPPSMHQGPGGALIEYDPSKPEGQRTSVLQPGEKTVTPPRVTTAANLQWEDVPGSDQQQGYEIINGQKSIVEGATRSKEKKPVATYGAGTQSKWLISVDEEGNVVNKVPNDAYQAPAAQVPSPNITAQKIQAPDPEDPSKLVWVTNEAYQPTPATAPTPNTIAPFIQVPDPQDPTKLIWVENRGRVTASEALKQLAAQLTGQVVDPNNPMGVDEAKTLIEAANARMTQDVQKAQTEATQAGTVRAAAGDILQTTSQGAQTGAGMLQNRVNAAQGMLGQVLGLAGQGQRSGNMGGGLMSSMPGIGAQLVGGIQDWATELGGGKEIYDTAARLVKAADPQGGGSPQAQMAYGVLGQMLERYQQQTGQPHPAVAATMASSASAGANGFVPPSTGAVAATPLAPVAAAGQPDWHLVTGPQDFAQQPTLPPGVAGTVPLNDPRRVGFTAPTITV